MRPNRPRRACTAVAILGSAGLATLALTGTASAGPPKGRVSLTPIGTYASGVFDESAAEIVAHDPGTQRLYVVNAEAGVLDVIDINDPTAPERVGVIEAGGDGQINSVAVHDGIVAAAVQAEVSQDPGRVEFYSAAGHRLGAVEVGALPDMLTSRPTAPRW